MPENKKTDYNKILERVSQGIPVDSANNVSANKRPKYDERKDNIQQNELGEKKEVQNKLLWAVSGKMAAELIYYRANATLPQMGLTSTSLPDKVRKTDIEIGKNYLNEEEIKMLKLIVEQFLAYAEMQAISHKPMYMRDWIEKLKQVLTMNDKNILEHAGQISHQLALQKANEKYEKFKVFQKQTEHLESIRELEKDIKRMKNKNE